MVNSNINFFDDPINDFNNKPRPIDPDPNYYNNELISFETEMK